MCIKPGIVPVIPIKLNGIKSNCLKVFRADIIGYGAWSNHLFAAPFINAMCARAVFP
jgi:hypothetical protein